MSDGPDGITFLDHTADVGLDVTAGTREELFHRAAVGMVALLRGRDDEGDPAGAAGVDAGPDEPVGPLSVELSADDDAGLLAAWLRELLFLHETRQVEYAGARFDRLTSTALEARVETAPAAPVREIKGVTYHGLAAERTAVGWTARVIFDV